ncbi:DUF6166 domain-containing protein [Deinococcus petrolearius]|uniref:DUF6166 domain-containing protein n=1 Tax=Deinococcus petrolearius TaxID=1751295 RepID=A0ABW1DL50_9DEIO
MTIPDFHLDYDPVRHEQTVTARDPDSGAPVPFTRIVNHSPTGLSFGYMGSGPSDLALTILNTHLPLDPDAPRTAQDVRRRLGIPKDEDSPEAAAFYARPEAELEEIAAREMALYDALPQRLHGGQWVRPEVTGLAYDFKVRFIAPLAQEAAHVLRASEVQAWLRSRLHPAPEWSWAPETVPDWTALLQEPDRLNALWAKLRGREDFRAAPVTFRRDPIRLRLWAERQAGGWQVTVEAQRTAETHAPVFRGAAPLTDGDVERNPPAAHEALIELTLRVIAQALTWSAEVAQARQGTALH